MSEAIALATIGRILSPLITNLILKGCSIFKDGIKGKLQILQNITLPKIRAVMEEAEKRGIVSQPLVKWLGELKEAAYEAEDILDEFDYKLLKRQAREKYSKAVSSFFSFASNASFKLKVRSSLENLDRIASGVDVFIQFLGLNNCNTISHNLMINANNIHVTTSELPEPKLFGRDEEKERILNLVNSTTIHDQLDVLVLPIVGVGGVGKTTLAQYVYNDSKIMEHFHPRMWIHMPQNFDEVRLTRRMIESVSGDACPDIDNFDVLQKKLRNYVEHKRFLLVLDDVWYDEKQSEFANKDRWSKLFAPLKHGDKGSVILITSRMELVAKTFSSEIKPLFLNGLNEEECLSLFNKYAFCVTDEKSNEHLMEIGKKIVKKIVAKLGGLPLAAKVVGGMLRNKTDADEWNNILKIDVWDDIMRVLTLSYCRLPPHLQRCIAHHGLYEKGFTCRRENLVHSWISQGLVVASTKPGDGMRMEDAGSLYLDELVFRSFFQCTDDGLFVLHDLMHDVADFVSRDECVRIVGDEKRAIPLTTRHLCIEIEKLSEYKKIIWQLKNLRTISFIFNPESKFITDHHCDLEDTFKKLRKLRTVDLSGCFLQELPSSIVYLKHLRFLDLSDSSVKALPKTVHKLHHLLHLDLRNCRLDSLPKDLNKMINLRHLMSDGRTLSMVPHIGKMAALQELHEFHVKKEKGYELRQLKNMENLRGTLRIVNLQNISNTNDAAEAILKGKSHLTELSLEWDCFYVGEKGVYPTSEFVDASNYDAMELVIDELQPPQQITTLKIKGYAGKRTPSWMRTNLCNSELQHLVLDLCVYWETLPSFGQLFPHLTEIVLKHCYNFCYLPFLPPTLRKIVLHRCLSVSLLTNEELQMLDVEQNFQSRPVIEDCAVEESLLQNPRIVAALENFKVCLENKGLSLECSSETLVNHLERWVIALKVEAITEKLNRTPLDSNNIQQLPSSLRHLHLHDCFVDDFTLSECLKRLKLLTHLELSKCLALTSLPSENTLCELKHLQLLDIEDCALLTSLGDLKKLASLQKLKINMCPNLMAVDQSSGALLPESLVELGIRDCGYLDKYLNRCLMGLTRLSRLAMASCMHLIAFPSAEELVHIKSLRMLHIRDCEELNSLGGLHVLASVHTLHLTNCPGLLTTNDAAEGLSSVSGIVLDNPSLLPVVLSRDGMTSVRMLGVLTAQDSAFTREQEQGLQRLTSLESLGFKYCKRLPCLPCNLRTLTCLEVLDVSFCPQIRCLPSLPTSLEYVNVEGCHPDLKQRCREGGPDWDLIKHIPERRII